MYSYVYIYYLQYNKHILHSLLSIAIYAFITFNVTNLYSLLPIAMYEFITFNVTILSFK